MLSLSLTALMAVATPVPCKAKAPAGMVGEWILIATADEQRTDRGSDEVRMTVADDGRVRFSVASLPTNSGTFTPAACSEGQAADLKTDEGMLLLAVYAVEGDELVLCFAEETAKRPCSLTPKVGQWSERWRRIKR